MHALWATNKDHTIPASPWGHQEFGHFFSCLNKWMKIKSLRSRVIHFNIYFVVDSLFPFPWNRCKKKTIKLGALYIGPPWSGCHSPPQRPPNTKTGSLCAGNRVPCPLMVNLNGLQWTIRALCKALCNFILIFYFTIKKKHFIGINYTW